MPRHHLAEQIRLSYGVEGGLGFCWGKKPIFLMIKFWAFGELWVTLEWSSVGDQSAS